MKIKYNQKSSKVYIFLIFFSPRYNRKGNRESFFRSNKLNKNEIVLLNMSLI